QDRGERHVPDRPARSRRLLQHALSRGLRPRRRGRGASRRQQRDEIRARDHVVISFPWCGVCPNCRRNMQSHCMKGLDLKMRGTRADGSTLMSKGGTPVYSAFFQQSSFATHAIANERYMVKVRKDAPLELLGPFACSGQTGAGAALNSM